MKTTANPQGDNFVAIVGMSCRFAGAADLRGYWELLLSGKPAFSDCGDASAERYLSEEIGSLRHLPTLKAGLLGELWRTSSSVREEGEINPVFTLAADLAQAALGDIATPEGTTALPRERVGAYIGHSPAIGPAETLWFQHGFGIDQTMEMVRRCFPHASAVDFETLRAAIDARLPQLNSRSARNLLPHALASFVAERCNIGGPAVCMDVGDVSVHQSIQTACDSLLAGRVDVALAGGVQGPVTPQFMMPFARMGFLSQSGMVKPYSREADGTLLGEGGGFLALKRHADAVKAGNRIYAVVKSVAMASSGNSKRMDGGYADALRASWSPDGAEPGAIDFLEGNGAGVAALDKAELRTFCSVLGDVKLRRDSIALGSVKSLIGDCLAGAGAAGAIKSALALYHRVIPPSLTAVAMAAPLDLDDTPFYLTPRARPWIHNDAGNARRAGVAAIGLGGLASFLVLEQTRR